MRISSLVLASVLLISAPAWAGNDIPKSSAIFGQAQCSPTFACPSSDSETMRRVFPQILNIAKSCLATYMGIPASPPVFEESLGLDFSGCLRTKSVPKNSNGLTMIPKCCVQPVSGNPRTCQIVCIRYGVK